MVVIWHQDEGVKVPPKTRHRSGKQAQEQPAILVVAEDRAPLVAPTGDMPDGARELQPERSTQRST
jgi:hypothetical protein